MRKQVKLILFELLVFSFVFAFGYTVTGEEQDTYISEEIQGYCVEIGEEYGVCPELLMAMIEAESSGNPKAENGDCKGLMQVSQKWHYDRMERLGVSDLFDPYRNILVATDYLVELFEKHGDLPLVLMIYNGSSDAFERAESGDFTEYAEKIINRSYELEEVHGKHITYSRHEVPRTY